MKPPLSFVYRLGFHWQLRVARWAPPALGAVSGSLVGYGGSGGQVLSWIAVYAFAAWGVGFALGSRWRTLRKLVRGPIRGEPSWTGGALAALGGTAITLWLSHSRISYLVFFLAGVALNIAYLGAKVRCKVFRCCEPSRRPVTNVGKVFAESLQDLEFALSLAVVTVALLLCDGGVQRYELPTPYLGHAAIRFMDWQLRLPLRGWCRNALDIGTGGFAIIGVAGALLLDRASGK